MLSLLNTAFPENSNRKSTPPEKSDEYRVFQFPRNRIPVINGDTKDWDIVPESYWYTTKDLIAHLDEGNASVDPKDLDVRVRAGWVKGLNRLYILYEVYDDYWDFERDKTKQRINDIFELVIDGDLSGGPFINNPEVPLQGKALREPSYIPVFLNFAGVHAQNYHIFVPAKDTDFGLVWGAQPWIAQFPYANFAYSGSVEHGKSGSMVMECWITPFDHAPASGPSDAVVTQLRENAFIGLCWGILDYDYGEDKPKRSSIASDFAMVKDADYLRRFRLMPIEPELRKSIEADFTFTLIDPAAGKVQFHDRSYGKITKWQWDFGDGTTSEEQHPRHSYKEPGVRYVVKLTVTGASGKDTLIRYWEVHIPYISSNKEESHDGNLQTQHNRDL